MNAARAELPDDVDVLKALVLAQQSLLSERAVEIEHLKLVIAKLKRLQFGCRSEKIDRDIEQLELRLEELQVSAVRAVPSDSEKSTTQVPVRKPLPSPNITSPTSRITPRETSRPTVAVVWIQDVK